MTFSNWGWLLLLVVSSIVVLPDNPHNTKPSVGICAVFPSGIQYSIIYEKSIEKYKQKHNMDYVLKDCKKERI